MTSSDCQNACPGYITDCADMSDSLPSSAPTRRDVPTWLYKLFTGHQYPYVRRQAKFSKPLAPGGERSEPTPDEIDQKFWEIFPRCSVKILEEVKTGMIVSFTELGA